MRRRLRSFGSYRVRPHGGDRPWWSLHASLHTQNETTEVLRSSYKPSLYLAADRILHREAPLTPTELRQCLVLQYPEIQSVFRYYREAYLDPNAEWVNGGLTPGSIRDVTALVPEGVFSIRRYPGYPAPTMDIPEIQPGEDRTIYPEEEFGPMAFLANPQRWRDGAFNEAGDFDPEWIEDARVACRILLKHGVNSTLTFKDMQNGVEWLQGIADILRNRYGGDWGI